MNEKLNGSFYIRIMADMKEEYRAGLSGSVWCGDHVFTHNMEKEMPIHRCIEVIKGMWRGYYITPEMIHCQAFPIGEVVEVSDDGDVWLKTLFHGPCYDGSLDRVSSGPLGFRMVRPIQKMPEYKITRDGEPISFSEIPEDELKRLREEG